ncbi:t-SNARE VTI1 [Marasmius tenuissimus]|uniref:t-SNARE VTI1 n=1 Tax=Marasmius tenuissimus TaxID=585030 RepID=A0ABR2ZCD7_9AGAR|nr:t-SNARE VTI1 [Marasmius tenuissimus]
MDETPASLFDAYHQDFEHIIRSVRDKLEREVVEQYGEHRKATLRKVELELDEADDLVSQLEHELSQIPASIRPQYASQLKQSKIDMNRLKRVAKDMHLKASRGELLGPNRMGTGISRSDDPYQDERTRLLSGTQTLEDGSRRLDDATRVALETEALGADILRNLGQDRERIEGTRDTLRKADTSIDRASVTLKGMIRQMYKQRFILSALAVVLVIVVFVILYFKLIR